jgi:hypothetical protein
MDLSVDLIHWILHSYALDVSTDVWSSHYPITRVVHIFSGSMREGTFFFYQPGAPHWILCSVWVWSETSDSTSSLVYVPTQLVLNSAQWQRRYDSTLVLCPIHVNRQWFCFLGWYVCYSCTAESSIRTWFLGRGRKGCKTRHEVLQHVCILALTVHYDYLLMNSNW